MQQVEVRGVCLLEKKLLLVQKEDSPPSALSGLVTSAIPQEPQGTAPFQEKAALRLKLKSFAASWL